MVINSLEYTIRTAQFRKPFRTAKGIFTHRRIIEVRAALNNSIVIKTEAVVFPEFAGPSMQECVAGLDLLKASLPFDTLTDFNKAGAQVHKPEVPGPVRAAFEYICIKALHITPGAVKFPLLERFSGYYVKVNGLLSEESVDDALERTELLLSNGYTCIKLKVGSKPEKEKEIIGALRNSFGYDLLLRLDANAAWNKDEAISFLRSCSKYNIQYVEQPTPFEHEFPEIKNRTGVALAVDESLRNYTDAMNIAANKYADYFVIKPHFVGGFSDSALIEEIGRQNGIGCVVSGSLETSLGRGLTILSAFQMQNDLHHGLSLNGIYLEDNTALYPVENGLIYFDGLW